jgi:uncharacterized protein YcfJ
VASAVPDSRTVRWSELLAVVDHKVAISLQDAYLEGRVEAVTTEHLELDVAESSNAVAYPTGTRRIPRSEVASLIVWTTTRRESAMGEQMVGYAASGGILGLGALGSSRGGHVLGRMAAGLGGALLGALAGRQLDKEEAHTVLHIVPDPAPTPPPGTQND